jgi:putative transcriptional regulator
MNEQLFNELLQSVREGGAILRGEAEPSRSFVMEEPDVSAIRRSFNLSQPKFASFLGISVRTLQNWEQKRRKPEGPAKVLLQVAARHPEAVLDVVSETTGDTRTVRAATGSKSSSLRAERKPRSRVAKAAGSSKSTKRTRKTDR